MTFEQNIARIQDWAQSAGIYEHSTVQAPFAAARIGSS